MGAKAHGQEGTRAQEPSALSILAIPAKPHAFQKTHVTCTLNTTNESVANVWSRKELSDHWGEGPWRHPALLSPSEEFLDVPLPAESIHDTACAPDMAVGAENAPSGLIDMPFERQSTATL
jgi:hypothetical protein